MEKLFKLTPINYNENTNCDIRRQIFIANATSNMSDLERAIFMGLPEGCRIREGAKIIAPEKLSVGRNVWIGENAVLDASGGLEIGEHTSIGLGVFVWTHDSHKLNRERRNFQENSTEIERLPTRIEEGCFIAGPSVIMPGAIVRKGTVIGPMSVVYKETEEDCIYTPYRNMMRMEKQMAKLKKRITQLENLLNTDE